MAADSHLGIYVHIPFCLRKCAYCAFYSEPIAQHDPRPLIDALLTELDRYVPAEPVQTLYLGGGSPTCLPRDLLSALLDGLIARIGSPEELTVECNPAQADAPLLETLRRRGVNRLSIGAQSFCPRELELLGRPHSAEAIAQTVRLARTAGFDNIGLDLIFAVPGSTVETFQQSLAKALTLDPTHLSAYSLTWEPGTPLTRALNAGRLSAVDEDRERRMYHQLCRIAESAGLLQYEISNFARAGCECRHNLRCWKNQPVLGLGPAASGWYRGQRTTNIPDIAAYTAAIQSGQWAWQETDRPSPVQIASETAILALRMTAGLDLADFARATGWQAAHLFADTIAEHRRTGLLELTGTHLRLTEKGRSLADTVACDFILPQDNT